MKNIMSKIRNGIEPYPRIRGNCIMCGNCCKSLMLTWKKEVVTSNEQYQKLLRWDPKVYERFIPDSEQQKGEPLRFSCVHQNDDNSCSVHESRPDICKTYPHRSIFKLGAELEEGCGYRIVNKGSFEDILDKKKLGKVRPPMPQESQ